MEMEQLDASLYPLIQSKEPRAAILDRFNSLYGHLTHADFAYYTHLLACVAIHYDYKRLVQTISSDKNVLHPSCVVKPLITAVHQNPGVSDIESLVIHNLSCAGCLFDTGYGIIDKEGMLTDEQTNVVDIIMERDDDDTLNTLLEYINITYLHVGPFAPYAMKHKAEKCLKVLMKYYSKIKAKKLDYESLVRYSKNKSHCQMLERVLYLVSDSSGKASDYLCNVAMCMYDSLELEEYDKALHLPTDIMLKIKDAALMNEIIRVYDTLRFDGLLTSDEIWRRLMVFPFLKQSKHGNLQRAEEKLKHLTLFPLQSKCDGSTTTLKPRDLTDVHHSVLLKLWLYLLDRLQIGYWALDDVVQQILQDISCFKCGSKLMRKPDFPLISKSLSFLNKLSQILLQHRAMKRAGIRLPPISSEPRLLNQPTMPIVHQIDRHYYQNLVIQLAHGESGYIFEKLKTKAFYYGEANASEQKVAKIVMSIHPHFLYESKRCYYNSNKLINPGPRLVILKSPACRTLRELCRAKLYESVPDRNMAFYVQQLVPRGVIQDFLTLGVPLLDLEDRTDTRCKSI